MREDKGEKEREGREIRFGCQYFGSAVAGGTVVNTNTHTHKHTTAVYLRDRWKGRGRGRGEKVVRSI